MASKNKVGHGGMSDPHGSVPNRLAIMRPQGPLSSPSPPTTPGRLQVPKPVRDDASTQKSGTAKMREEPLGEAESLTRSPDHLQSGNAFRRTFTVETFHDHPEWPHNDAYTVGLPDILSEPLPYPIFETNRDLLIDQTLQQLEDTATIARPEMVQEHVNDIYTPSPEREALRVGARVLRFFNYQGETVDKSGELHNQFIEGEQIPHLKMKGSRFWGLGPKQIKKGYGTAVRGSELVDTGGVLGSAASRELSASAPSRLLPSIDVSTFPPNAMAQSPPTEEPQKDRKHAESDSESSSFIDQMLDWDCSESTSSILESIVAQRLLHRFLVRADDKHGMVEHAGQPSRKGRTQDSQAMQGQSLSTSANINPSFKGLGKRHRGRDDEDCEDDDDEGRRNRPFTIVEESANSSENAQLWACPFYKKDRHRYPSCGRSILRNISRVKYHVRRYHQPKIHCDRCSKTFETETQRVEHTRMVAPCSLNEVADWDGITEDQKQELSKKTSSKISARENWYHIYTILFPRQDVPESPFLEGLESQELRRILAFAEREGPNIVHDVLTELPEYQNFQPEDFTAYLNSATQEFVTLLFERWESDGQREIGALASPRPPSSFQRNQTTSSSSTASLPTDLQDLQDIGAPPISLPPSTSLPFALNDTHIPSDVPELNPDWPSGTTNNDYLDSWTPQPPKNFNDWWWHTY